MADVSVFDVVLLGYRNDVAQARTMEFLDRLALGPARLDRGRGLPQRLFTALGRDDAQRLRAALEGCGAQVALVEVGHVRPASAAVAQAAHTPARSSPHGFGFLLAVALAGAIYLLTADRPAPRAVRPLPPAVTDVEPLAVDAGDSDQSDAQKLNAAAAALAGSRDFAAAVAHLQDALRLAPNDPALTHNLQTVLLNWGIANLAAERIDDAAVRLEEAAQLGERAEVLRTLGIARLREGDYTAAARALERALQLAPQDRQTLLALAEVYLKQDQRPQALDLLQRAKESGVRSTDLDKKVQQLGREVDAEWDFVQTESPHFRVSFADSEDSHAVRMVLAALEEAHDAVGVKFNHYPDERTPVVLYTQQDFHTVTQTPDWAGAAFDGRIKLPVRGLQADDAQLQRVVRHEYAHSLITQLSNGRAPVWLNEGLAVWAEEAADGERESWAEQKIAGQELFTLDQLNGSFVQMPAPRAEVAYAQSYLAIRALLDEYGPRKIPALLTAVGRSRDMNEAFAATYSGDLAGFQERLLRRLTVGS